MCANRRLNSNETQLVTRVYFTRQPPSQPEESYRIGHGLVCLSLLPKEILLASMVARKQHSTTALDSIASVGFLGLDRYVLSRLLHMSLTFLLVQAGPLY